MKPPEPTPKRPSFWRVMRAMMGIAWRTHPGMFLTYLLSSLAFTALLVADLHLVRLLLDRLPGFVDGQLSLQAVVQTVLMLGGINVLYMLVNAVMNFSYELLSRLAEARMGETMSAKAGRLELIRFESSELYDDIEKAHSGRRRGLDAMETLLCSLIFHGGYFLFLALYLARLEPWLILGVFLSFLPVAVSRAMRASAFYYTEVRVAPLRREFNHYEACLTDRAYFKETRTTGAVPFFRRKYDQTLERYNQEMWRTEVRTGLIDLGLKVLTLAGYAGLLLMLVKFVIVGRISPGLFGAVYFAMDAIFKWFDELFDRLGYALENAGFGGNYLDFLASPERARGTARLPRDGGVVLQDVSFRYPGAGQNAVDGVSLRLRPGESVAIVGENGAGKSSLVRLISGLYQPDSGTIHIGGVDLRQATAENRFERLSAVFQHYQRYRMTLLDNVRIAEPGMGESAPTAGARQQAHAAPTPSAQPPDTTPTASAEERGRASAALRQAGFYQAGSATETIELDTMLSREFGGVDLSGGEWQRVAIARGLYRPHDTIILDEPTAAIDPLEEDRVYRTFLDLARGKTAIIVTHRLGLARSAERILVMDRGRLVQDGTHAELMRAEGLYARMFKAQAAWYVREEQEEIP